MMVEVKIIRWRDIPAQVITEVVAGRRKQRGISLELPSRFAKAIDEAAMRCGAVGTDDYLAGWQKRDITKVHGDDSQAEEAAKAMFDSIIEEYPQGRLAGLVANGGYETSQNQNESKSQ